MKGHYQTRYLNLIPNYPFSIGRFTAICILLFTLFSSAHGQVNENEFKPESVHWLQFRGPNASGIAPEEACPPLHFSADTNLLWKTEILPGWSSPCIVNEMIFLTGFNKKDSMLHTMAVNRENGEILWQDSVRLPWAYDLHPVNTYANPTVASNGTQVFSHFPGYGLIAYDLDGRMNWEFRHEPIGARTAQGGSPVVMDSLILVNVNYWKDPRIQALDCRTGDTLWAIREPDHKQQTINCAASPVIHDDLIILHQKTKIVAYSITDKHAVWWLNTPTTGTSTPVIHDDVIYASTWVHLGEKKLFGSELDFESFLSSYDSNGNRRIEKGEAPDSLMIAIRPERNHAVSSSISFNRVLNSRYDQNRDGAMDEEEWNAYMKMAEPYMGKHGMMAIPVSGSYERPYTDVLWKVIEDTPETPSPIVSGEYVLFIKSGGILTVVNRKTGEVFKKERIGAAGSYLASPMLANNRIYMCSYNGTITVLSAEDFSVLTRNKIKGKIGASPVAVDDVLYIRTDTHLYAFREP